MKLPTQSHWQRGEAGWLAVGLLVCLLLGCNQREVKLSKVTGYVKLDGQPPPAAGTIYFSPLESLGDQPLRPSQAAFARDGFFRASAYDGASGLVPGKYRVSVDCWEVAPSMDGPPARSHIPERYTSPATSELELVVQPDAGSIRWNVELVGAAK